VSEISTVRPDLYKMQYSMLKSVTSDPQQWTIKVRAVRFSEYVSEDNLPKAFRLDMVLLDEEVRVTYCFYPYFCIVLTEQ
jgi:hypothetical protein